MDSTRENLPAKESDERRLEDISQKSSFNTWEGGGGIEI